MTTRTSTTLRVLDVSARDMAVAADCISQMYNNEIDVVVVRGAVRPEPLAAVAESFERGEQTPAWNRPNAQVATEDIQVLGVAATPTYSTPRGPSLDEYLESATWHQRAPVFDEPFDPVAEITRALSRVSGGRPVALLSTPDGREFAPFTVRRLAEGKGIGLHHDLHTSLAMFRDVAPALDTHILVSYVVTLQGPESGGELVVYNVAPDTPDAPKMPNGFQWDLAGVEARFDSVKVQTGAGDLFLFASARCLHRVAPVVGSRARVTMGGFLAMDRGHERVLYWS
jgi:hypothetical protein